MRTVTLITLAVLLAGCATNPSGFGTRLSPDERAAAQRWVDELPVGRARPREQASP